MSTPDVFSIPDKPIDDYDGEDIVAYLTGVIAKIDGFDIDGATDDQKREFFLEIVNDVRALRTANDRTLQNDPAKLAKTHVLFGLVEVVAQNAISGLKPD